MWENCSEPRERDYRHSVCQGLPYVNSWRYLGFLKAEATLDLKTIGQRVRDERIKPAIIST